jgi:lysophospholipase L1-like esterase
VRQSGKVAQTVKVVLPNLVLAAGSIVFCLLACEGTIRTVHPKGSLRNYPNFIHEATKPDLEAARETIQYDPELGYCPVPNSAGSLHGHQVAFSDQGFRLPDSGSISRQGQPVLALGDSFTEGWGVDAGETWPAQLERQTGHTILNGGVRGYGLDQMVLRGERLLAHVRPSLVVLAFIQEDIDRLGFSVLTMTRRPYFVPAGEGLELKNIPVPRIPYDGPHRLWRRIFGYSYLLDYGMRKLGFQEVWYGYSESNGVDPDLMACKLMHRFALDLRAQTLPGLVVALPTYNEWKTKEARQTAQRRNGAVLDCARAAGLATLDVRPGLQRAGVGETPQDFYSDTFHFNPKGLALIANEIASVPQAH